MEIKQIKVATLNLWQFNEWKIRLPRIIAVLDRVKPDIVFLQEVQRDLSRSKYNQVEILNQSLKYPYSKFARADIKTMRKGVALQKPIDHGLGILSKFPFESEIITLKKDVDGKENRILLKVNLDIMGFRHIFTNVHFTNSDTGSEKNFKETLSIFDNLKIKSVLIGDLNIKDIVSLKSLYGKRYTASSELYQYLSYPQDNLSYDHMLLPHGYTFVDFQCIDEDISDHCMLVAILALPS